MVIFVSADIILSSPALKYKTPIGIDTNSRIPIKRNPNDILFCLHFDQFEKVDTKKIGQNRKPIPIAHRIGYKPMTVINTCSTLHDKGMHM
jgi:hypothetical protein